MANPTPPVEEITAIEEQLLELKKRRTELIHQLPMEAVEDYELRRSDGSPVRLSELFVGREELLTVHNMGGHCAYCTLWADGFVGLLPHLESRAAFVLVSNDEPAAAAEFARSRGWNFPVVSGRGSRFTPELGFWNPSEGAWPGVSAFHRDPDGRINRTGKLFFGPGDDFCAVWHFFDLLAGGPSDWQPRIAY